MRKAGNVTVVRAMLFLVSILVLMSANVTVGWLIDARVFALVTLTIAMVAALMVVYFDWRAKMLNLMKIRTVSELRAGYTGRSITKRRHDGVRLLAAAG
jgi:hypothetical protein